MFSVRFLSGPNAGQRVELQKGRNIIGRGPSCQIQIQSTGVSKEHCELHVFNDRIVLKDLGSSNGSFLNGVKVQTGILRTGDKFSVYDIVMELIPTQAVRPNTGLTNTNGLNNQGTVSQFPTRNPQSNFPQNPMQGSLAYQSYPQHQSQPGMQQQPQMQAAQSPPAPQMISGIQDRVEHYLYEGLLPGVYKLAEIMPLKYVLGLFVFIYIFCVTFLSVIPMMRVNQESIFTESRRRAMSIARTIAQTNQQAFLQGSYAALTTQSAEVEEGVKMAFIVQQADGLVVAPAIRAGRTSDLPFVQKVRNESKSVAEMIDSKTLAASFPIGQYDPNTGEPSVKAHAIVIYDVGAMSLDSGRVISLFMQTFLIAAALGGILFFFMYQLIENPIRLLNISLDQALREKKENIESPYQFPVLQALATNMSSLLTRAFNPIQNSSGDQIASKDMDMERMLLVIEEPMLIIRANETILGVNDKFAQIARSSAHILKDQGINAIQDNALQQNINHLVNKSREMSYTVHQDQLEFSGHLCTLRCSAILDNGNPSYFIITVMPQGGT